MSHNLNPITSTPILVTGGTGFLAGHVIQQLLAKGYKVRATVRDVRLAGLVEHLFRFPESAANLQLVEADITKPDTLPPCLEGGVEYVFHLATAYSLHVPEGSTVEEFLYKPAVKGTVNVLAACARVPSVKKVIMTSCIWALSDEFDNAKVYNELDWNSTSSMTRNPYAYAKTCAERAAWEFMERFNEANGGLMRRNTTNNYANSTGAASAAAGGNADGSSNSSIPRTFLDPDVDLYGISANKQMRLITILPGVMLGPHLGGRVNYSHRFLLLYLEAGRMRGVLNFSLPIADVRDVAACHILTMESYRTEGSRYCLTNKPVHMVNILQTIHENFVDIKLPSRRLPDALVRFAVSNAPPAAGERQFILHSLGRTPNISCIKAKGLGMTLRPPVQTIVDSARYLMDSDNLGDAANRTGNATTAAALCTIM